MLHFLHFHVYINQHFLLHIWFLSNVLYETRKKKKKEKKKRRLLSCLPSPSLDETKKGRGSDPKGQMMGFLSRTVIPSFSSRGVIKPVFHCLLKFMQIDCIISRLCAALLLLLCEVVRCSYLFHC